MHAYPVDTPRASTTSAIDTQSLEHARYISSGSLIGSSKSTIVFCPALLLPVHVTPVHPVAVQRPEVARPSTVQLVEVAALAAPRRAPVVPLPPANRWQMYRHAAGVIQQLEERLYLGCSFRHLAWSQRSPVPIETSSGTMRCRPCGSSGSAFSMSSLISAFASSAVSIGHSNPSSSCT